MAFKYPIFSKVKTEVETYTETVYLEDIIDITLPNSSYITIYNIVQSKLAELNKIYETISHSNTYKEFRELYRKVIHQINQLIVLDSYVLKQSKRAKASFRHIARYFLSVPRKTGNSIRDFVKMRRYKEKKGKIQLYHFYKVKEINNKYKPHIKYAPNKVYNRKKEIEERLEELSYLGKTDQSLIDELNLIKENIKSYDIKRKKYETIRNKEIETLTLGTKTEIDGILELLYKNTSIDSFSFSITRQHYDFDTKKILKKADIILNDSRKNYNKKVNEIIHKIENWKEIYYSDKLTKELQDKIDIIKEEYLKKEEVIVNKIETEINESMKIYLKRYYSIKKELDESLIKVKDLYNIINAKFNEYNSKLEPYIEKEK
jgi:hypothetical protein